MGRSGSAWKRADDWRHTWSSSDWLTLQMWASDVFDRVPVRALLAGGAVVAIAAKPSVLAAGTAVVLLVLSLATATQPLHQERTFFGVLEVRSTPGGDAHVEYSGTTLHGAQLLGEGRREPTTYYVKAGPVGDVFDDLRARTHGASMGVVGLGVGTIAAYANPGDALTFYEIDRATIDIATDARFFSYLADAAVTPDLVLDDARLSLAVEPAAIFDVLVLDAFSSDSVPAHLLTKEAMTTYMRTLRPGAVMAFHLSNRYYDLPPAVAATARSLGLAAVARTYVPDGLRPELLPKGSSWVVIGEDVDAFIAKGWVSPPDGPILTDDFSDLLRIFRPGA